MDRGYRMEGIFGFSDYGFNDPSSLCLVKFWYRGNGDPRCKLMLDEMSTKMLRGMGANGNIKVRVDDFGNIIVSATGGSLALSQDLHGTISLDRYAEVLLGLFGSDRDVPYDRIITAGTRMVILAPIPD
jgi:hypothetical protein